MHDHYQKRLDYNSPWCFANSFAIAEIALAFIRILEIQKYPSLQPR
jgi:hypothetical protein